MFFCFVWRHCWTAKSYWNCTKATRMKKKCIYMNSITFWKFCIWNICSLSKRQQATMAFLICTHQSTRPHCSDGTLSKNAEITSNTCWNTKAFWKPVCHRRFSHSIYSKKIRFQLWMWSMRVQTKSCPFDFYCCKIQGICVRCHWIFLNQSRIKKRQSNTHQAYWIQYESRHYCLTSSVSIVCSYK